ncbi:MAG TPA: hypothetical protein VFB34_05040 [Chloroflexota bacterium]|nr:hypothetical protein [Chloroflexota bacterium]
MADTTAAGRIPVATTMEATRAGMESRAATASPATVGSPVHSTIRRPVGLRQVMPAPALTDTMGLV